MEVKKEEVPKVVITTDIVVESSALPGKEGSKGANIEVQITPDPDGGIEVGVIVIATIVLSMMIAAPVVIAVAAVIAAASAMKAASTPAQTRTLQTSTCGKASMLRRQRTKSISERAT